MWPDQLARIRLLRGAIEVARRVPAPVDRAPASGWLRRNLVHTDGVATVVFHSIVSQYMDDAEQSAVAAALAEAGGRATREAPFAYLRMEPDEDDPKIVEVRLTTWPGGRRGGLGRTAEQEELVAHTGYHGNAVRWLG